MSDVYLEDGFEKIFIKAIEDLGYEYVAHQDIVRYSMKSPIASEMLRESLRRINYELEDAAIDAAIHVIKNIDAGLLVDRNEIFFEYLQNGIEIVHLENDMPVTDRVHLIDYDHFMNNTFVVTNQLTIVGKDTKRPDVLVYVNGLPLVVVELKSMTSLNSDVSSAYRQIKNYQHDIEELFVYNVFNIISDFTTTKVGTITAGESWYKEWKSTDGSYESTKYADYKTLVEGVLEQHRLLDIIRNFIFSSIKMILQIKSSHNITNILLWKRLRILLHRRWLSAMAGVVFFGIRKVQVNQSRWFSMCII